MTLPAPNLDDLRFQSDLVDEARKRIVNYCPEWTDYNLSDPGITLIELFAWMTEMMVYRLNRVPEKNYIKFLEMLGMQRMPAASARTELTFWLSAGLPMEPGSDQTVLIPQGFEVRSEQSDESIIFTTTHALEIVPPLTGHVRRESDFQRNFASRMDLEVFLPFSQPQPQPGDSFYIGFSPQNNIRGHILQLEFTCEPTEAVGIRREDPPWVWECLNRDGSWQELRLSNDDGEKDTTGGLNNEQGHLTLYLPLTFSPSALHGLESFWIRCRVEQRNPLQGMYTESPRIRRMEAFSLGASVEAMHSMHVLDERLGVSDGEPGQSFQLEHAPLLALQEGEYLQVEETRAGEDVFVPWEQVTDFSKSGIFDRHYRLDMASGTVTFGPSIRQPDGSVLQYGRIPESGRPIRFSRYRFGGGVKGNLPLQSLTTMSMPLAYVARVTNLTRAAGGRDQEGMEELKLRSQRELQAQRRAVTLQDFEQFALSFSRSVARAKCLGPNDMPNPQNSSSVQLLIVPSVAAELRAGGLASLRLVEGMANDLRAHLDQFRLMTTSLIIREPRYFGVCVKARVVPQDFIAHSLVVQRVDEELRRFLSPLALDERPPLLSSPGGWQGWPFGRDLFTAEVISLIQQVPLVKYVLDVQVSYREVVPAEEREGGPDPDARGGSNGQVQAQMNFGEKPVNMVLQVPADALLCSLRHEIEITSLERAYERG